MSRGIFPGFFCPWTLGRTGLSDSGWETGEGCSVRSDRSFFEKAVLLPENLSPDSDSGITGRSEVSPRVGHVPGVGGFGSAADAGGCPGARVLADCRRAPAGRRGQRSGRKHRAGGSRYIAWLTIEDVQGERKLKTRAGEAIALAGKANAPIRARVDQLVVRGVIFRRERTETAASGPIGSRKSARRPAKEENPGRGPPPDVRSES